MWNSSLRSSNSFIFSFCMLKICTSFIPEMFSDKKPLICPVRLFIVTKLAFIFFFIILVKNTIKGITVKPIKANWKSILIIIAMIPTSRKISLKSSIMISVKSSLNSSTSLVALVISRPVEYLSKRERGRR